MLAALVAAAGGEPWLLPARRRHRRGPRRGARAGRSDADLLLISGGVSAGKFDLVEPALARVGRAFPLHRRAHPARQAAGLRRTPARRRRLRCRSSACPAIPSRRRPPSCSSPRRCWRRSPAAAIRPALFRWRSSPATDRKGKPGLTRFLPAHCDFAQPSGKRPQVATVPWHGSGDLPPLPAPTAFWSCPKMQAPPRRRRDRFAFC